MLLTKSRRSRGILYSVLDPEFLKDSAINNPNLQVGQGQLDASPPKNNRPLNSSATRTLHRNSLIPPSGFTLGAETTT